MMLSEDVSANKLIRVLNLEEIVWGNPQREYDGAFLAGLYLTICDLVEKFLENLPERDKEIVKMRCGIHENAQIHTLEEVAEKSQVTRERVRQIEQRNLATLRHPKYSATLEAFLEKWSSR